MIIWIDAQLSPHLAVWISTSFGIAARAVRDLKQRDTKDRDIYLAARNARAIVMTKDSDFLVLLDELGPPPQILWVTCGNTSNAALKATLSRTFPAALEALKHDEPLVEISDAH